MKSLSIGVRDGGKEEVGEVNPNQRYVESLMKTAE